MKTFVRLFGVSCFGATIETAQNNGTALLLTTNHVRAVQSTKLTSGNQVAIRIENKTPKIHSTCSLINGSYTHTHTPSN